MSNDVRSQAIALYDRFTHGGLERRAFMARMAVLAGSAAAAETLIAAIAASPAAAAMVPEDDRRLRTQTVNLLGPLSGLPQYRAYVAEPVAKARESTVMVIHENRGLNEHIRDVARRLALAGFYAVAPDFLSPGGGTPADADAARAAIGKLDVGEVVRHAVAMTDEFRARLDGGRHVGAVGFCWGGAFVNRLAVAAGGKLDAGVSFYGPAPDPAEAARVQAPLMIHLAGLDERVNRTAYPWVDALRGAGKRVTYHGYDGVNHAFHNDTSAERYDKAAAELAWARTLRFFKRHLS